VVPSHPLASDRDAVARVSRATGLAAADVRRACAMGRAGTLARSDDLASLERMRDALRALGHAAAILPDAEIRRALFPIACKRVDLDGEAIRFLDGEGRELARMPRGERALVIVANTADRGESPAALVSAAGAPATADAVYADAERRLARLLSTNLDTAAIDVSWGDGAERVRIWGGRFHFGSMGARGGAGVATNMRALVDEIAGLATRPVVDTSFGRAMATMPALGGASSGADRVAIGRALDRPRDAREAALEEHCRRVHGAWRAGLFDALAAKPLGGRAYYPARAVLPDAESAAGVGRSDASAAVAVGGSHPALAPRPADAPPLADRVLARVRRFGSPAIVLPLTVVLAATALRHAAAPSRATAAIAALCGAGLLIARAFALTAWRRRIENVPTSRIRSAAIGLCEIKGVAQPLRPLVTPFSLMPCVYYEYRMETRESGHRSAWWSATGDAAGSVTTLAHLARAHARSRAATWAGDSGDQPFVVQDDTGSIEVRPRGATLHVGTEQTFFNPPFEGVAIAPGTAVKVRERYIPVGHPIYVMGELRRDAGERAHVARPSAPDLFTISEQSECAVVGSLRRRARAYMIAGIALALVGCVLAAPAAGAPS
jgi:hypothetical protein